MENESSLKVLVTIPLSREHRDKIAAADPRIALTYEETLMPEPRYEADKVGEPMEWSNAMESRWLDLLKETDVLFGFDRRHMSELPDLAPKLKWIQGSSTGIGTAVADHGWTERGIVVTSASGVHAVPLAEFHAMAILAFSKDIHRMFEHKEAKAFERYCTGQTRGKTLGVIGLGKNGREIAGLAKAMGMRVIGTKRNWEPSTMWPELGVEYLYPIEDLHRMLGECDFVSVTPPSTPETQQLIDADALAAMKPGTVLINTSRGTVVDEDALVDALRGGNLAGAALDVFEVEPLPPESPLWDMDNVLIMPHSASCAEHENDKLTDLFVANLLRYLDDQPLLNVIDPRLQY